MPRLDADWHRSHPMPPRATLDQRVQWHLEHAAVCGCRAIPASVLRELKARGIDAAARRSPPPTR